jgi:sec-independent protein translocase protein TatA
MNSLSIYFGMIGGMQIAIIVVVVLLFFGGKKIPELMKGLGSGIKEFKNAAKEESEEKSEEKTEQKIEDKK